MSTKSVLHDEKITPKLTHHEYTVGWICALPKEQAAATVMLDELHENLPNPVSDYNTYILGSIGSHNVVIACLPKGQMGTSSAAVVATRIVNTFPSIRTGLMVGIGGGIPPKVRLRMLSWAHQVISGLVLCNGILARPSARDLGGLAL
jgi:nucleoside phosphorylase